MVAEPEGTQKNNTMKFQDSQSLHDSSTFFPQCNFWISLWICFSRGSASGPCTGSERGPAGSQFVSVQQQRQDGGIVNFEWSREILQSLNYTMESRFCVQEAPQCFRHDRHDLSINLLLWGLCCRAASCSRPFPIVFFFFFYYGNKFATKVTTTQFTVKAKGPQIPPQAGICGDYWKSVSMSCPRPLKTMMKIQKMKVCRIRFDI